VIPQAIWLVGLGLFVLVGIVLFTYALRRAVRGEPGAVAAAIGTRSAEEDVEAEVRSLEKRRSR
jgi:hypothetical protein